MVWARGAFRIMQRPVSIAGRSAVRAPGAGSDAFARFGAGRVSPEELARLQAVVAHAPALLREAGLTADELLHVLCLTHTGTKWAFATLGEIANRDFGYAFTCDSGAEAPLAVARIIQVAQGPVYSTVLNLQQVRHFLELHARASQTGEPVVDLTGVPEAPGVRLTLEQRFEALGVEEATHLRAIAGHPRLTPIPPGRRSVRNATVDYVLQPHEFEALVLKDAFLKARYGESPLAAYVAAIARQYDGFAELGGP